MEGGVSMVLLIMVALWIALDFITGFLKALYEHNIDSTVLRKGLFHKFSEFLVVALGYGLDEMQIYIDLPYTIPMFSCFSAYIIIMEICSVLENICAINPELNQLLQPYLSKLKKGGDENQRQDKK